MIHIRRALPIGATLLVLVLGCGQEPTRPAANVWLTLTAVPATGSPAQPVTVEATVRNFGSEVFHCVGCGCGNGTDFIVLGPDGKAVNLFDPNGPRPACADGSAPLERGMSMTSGRLFTGTLYPDSSSIYPTPTYAAPAGRYTVVATFTYWRGPYVNRVSIRGQATFDWRP